MRHGRLNDAGYTILGMAASAAIGTIAGMSNMPAPHQSASRPPPARLNSDQLRELSRQWRQRVDEDPLKVQRVASVLEWLAVQREAPTPPLVREQQRQTLWQALALWRARLSRLSRPHLAR